MTFISKLIESSSNSEFWLLGDFNTDFLKRNVCTTKVAIDTICKLGSIQLIKIVTRPAFSKGMCIDWILTNSEYLALSCFSNNLISDHYPIVCIRKKAREFKVKEPRFIRLYSKLNLEVLGNLLLSHDWSVYDVCEDVDTK